MTFLNGLFRRRTIDRDLNAEIRQHFEMAIADRIAAGDLTQVVATSAGDRGSMMAALQRMQDQLRWIVSNIRASSDSIRLGSGEITAGNQNLSQRTEEQASALEETSASMQQMTATVGQNAQNAKKVNELAAQASGIAAKGGEVVREAVGTMNGITAAFSANRFVWNAISSITPMMSAIFFEAPLMSAMAFTALPTTSPPFSA